MSTSQLVTYTNLTAHKSTRQHAIDSVIIHCYVGQVTAKKGCDFFVTTPRSVSANYVVGYDGSIGLSVEEKYRAWTSGGTDSKGNEIKVNGIAGSTFDHRAITIEVASETVHPYTITDKAYAALLDLLTDICKRNGIKQLLWQGNKALVGQTDKQNMAVHRWFANKACPGDYLYNKHGEIAAEVNKRLGSAATPTPAPTPATDGLYRVRKSWADDKSQIGAYKSLKNAQNSADKNAGYKVYDSNGKCVYSGKEAANSAFIPYLARVTVAVLNIRAGAGTNYPIVGTIRDRGVYTIVEVQNGWGRLKSGVGWVSLTYAQKL